MSALMRAAVLPHSPPQSPLRYPECLQGERFREYQTDELARLSEQYTVLVELPAIGRLYHVCYCHDSSQARPCLTQTGLPEGVHELCYYRGTTDQLAAHFAGLNNTMKAADRVEQEIRDAVPGLKVSNRDLTAANGQIARRIYRTSKIRIELAWGDRETILVIKSITPTSEFQLVRRKYSSPVCADDLVHKIVSEILGVMDLDNNYRPQFYKFVAETHRMPRDGWFQSTNSLKTVRFVGIGRLEHRRIYQDIERPGTECWYLLDTCTHDGNTLSMITDGDQFCPVRLSNSSTILATVIDSGRLPSKVKLDNIGPADQQLIAAAIKHGLDQRFAINLAARS